MSEPELGKITLGLDEVSFKKQFGGQPQALPCWPKNSHVSESSALRNGTYFQWSDFHVPRDSTSRNLLHHPLASPLVSKYAYHNHQRTFTSPDSVHSKASESLVYKKGKSSNPYSRPLSAKEFGQNFSESKPSLSSSISYLTNCKPSPSPSLPTGSTSSNFPTNINFFLRPQSLTMQTATVNKDGQLKHSLAKCDKSETSCNSSKELHRISGNSFAKQTAFLSTLPTSSLHVLASVNKHVSSIPKPGVGLVKVPDSPLSVRNLNYTPAVSYVETKQLYENERHDTKEEASVDEMKEVGASGQTIYYKIAYKAEKCLSETKLKTVPFFTPDVPKTKPFLSDQPQAFGDSQDDVDIEARPASLQSVSSIQPDSNFIKRGRLLGDGDNAINSEGETDDCLTEETDSDYEEESDVASSCSSLSRQLLRLRPLQTSLASEKPGSIPIAAKVVLCPALTRSSFSNVPPTINFVYNGCKVETLSAEMRRLLRWRLSPITPLVVKSALVRVGFRITNKNFDWIGCFGKHMKSQAFRSLRDFQKLNHFPGSFQIGRKDRLWRNLSKLQLHFTKKEYGFFPQTFVLPSDLKLFKKSWEDGGNRVKWIVKPPASARGKGIKVVHKWSQIPKRRPIIVQKYLSRPFLINSSKFDIRLYVLVSSFDPLRIYLYDDGLVRFASCKYTTATSSLNNRCIHLTNYSINKMNPFYQNNMGENFQGHKWSLKALWNYLKKQGINSQAIWESIKDIIIKTIISGEAVVSSMTRANLKSPYSVYELFGFDIILDENLKPWLLEVNISPSLHSNTTLDVSIKEPLVCDVLNIAGFHLPAKDDLVAHVVNNHLENDQYKPPNNYCLDKRLYSSNLSADEKVKHIYYCQRHLDSQIQQTILDILTPYDIRTLLLSLDEEKRAGSFDRIFPTNSTTKYLRFFEQPRYSSLLLDQWFQQFPKMDTQGCSLLKSYCEIGIHLQNPTADRRHQWILPTLSAASVHSVSPKSPSPIGKTQEKKGTVEKSR